MNELELEKAKLASLQEYNQSRGNETIASIKESPFAQPFLAAADSITQPLYNAAVGIDRYTASKLGSTPILEPLNFNSGAKSGTAGLTYDVSRGVSDMARHLAARTPMGAVMLGGGINAAENPLDPLKGFTEGAGYAALGESLGPVVGKVIGGAGKAYSGIKDSISLDSATAKYVKELADNYNISSESAWNLMKGLVGKADDGGLGNIPLSKEIPAQTFTPEKGAETYLKSKEFTQTFGKDAKEEFGNVLNDAIEFGGEGSKDFSKTFDKYLNSADFKNQYGKEASALKEEYKEMFESMTEYLGGKVVPGKTEFAPGIDKFMELSRKHPSLIPTKGKELIKVFNENPTIENAYEVTKELNKAKAKLGPGDVELSNVYDEMIGSLRKGFKSEGGKVSPNAVKEFEQGNQAFARDVAPYYSNKTIEAAAGGNALPTVEIRSLVDAIEKNMQIPARGKYPTIPEEHFLAKTAARANKDIAKSDLAQSNVLSKMLIGLTGGMGTFKSRELEREFIKKLEGAIANSKVASAANLLLKNYGPSEPEAIEISLFGE